MINQTLNQTSIEVLWTAIELTLRDLATMLPKVLLAFLIIVVYIVLMMIINRLLRRTLTLLRIDELVKPVIAEAYISLTGLIILLVDIGIILLSVYSVILAFFPEQIHIANIVLDYLARYASIVFIIIISFIVLSAIVRYIRVEAKLKGFMFLLLLFVTLILTIDIATLSPEIKTALAWGISIGITGLIIVFATWYFYHDILEDKRRKS